MIHTDTILPALQSFTPRESLYSLLMRELQQSKARKVADDLQLMIVSLRSTKTINSAEEELLWRAQEWLEGGVRLTEPVHLSQGSTAGSSASPATE